MIGLTVRCIVPVPRLYWLFGGIEGPATRKRRRADFCLDLKSQSLRVADSWTSQLTRFIGLLQPKMSFRSSMMACLRLCYTVEQTDPQHVETLRARQNDKLGFARICLGVPAPDCIVRTECGCA